MKQLLIFVLCLVGLSGTRLLGQDLVWVKQTGSTNNDFGTAIAVDAFGNTYTTGYFGATLDFDPGPGVFTMNASAGAIYVLKLDANGTFVWAKQMGGSSNTTSGWAIAVDHSGNVYSTGAFSGTGDFDPGAGSVSFTSLGGDDIYLSKLDNSGNLLWVTQYGGTNRDRGYSLSIDDQDNVLMTGVFSASVDFDPSIGTNLLSSNGGTDVFILKTDPLGNMVWAKSVGGTGSEEGWDIAAAPLGGGIFVTGSFVNTVDFDPNSGMVSKTAVGGADAYLLKLDILGNFSWVNPYGTTFTDEGYAIYVEPTGNVKTSGRFAGTIDFDLGTGVFNLSGGTYIATVDGNNGNYISALSIGLAQGGISAQKIAGDAFGNTYVAGFFMQSGQIDVDPGPGVYNMTSLGTNDNFFLKISPSGDLVWGQQIGGTGNDLVYGLAVYEDNLYSCGMMNGVVDFDPGSGVNNMTSVGFNDAFVLKLTRCIHSSAAISPIVCDNYTSPSGQILTTTGTYQDTIPNVGGCDSVITINLTIHPSATSTLTATSCTGSYLSPSGNYTWTVSGTYLDTLSTINGCDSVITVNLSVNSVNATATANGNVLTASTSGATYQWLDCNGMTIIAGENGQSFSPAVSGSYAVAVTENGCTDTSACFTVTIIGIDASFQANTNAVYPNPSEGIFHFTGPDIQSVMVFNALGQRVFSERPNQGGIDLSFLPKGMYWLRTQSDDGLSLPTTIRIE